MRDRVTRAGLDARRRSLMWQALDQRRLEARAHLRGPAAPIPDSTEQTTPAQEEALRILMVKHYPRARAGELTVAAWDAALGLFDAIVQPTTRDLRFLDAWNNFYEALGPRARQEQRFLARYVGVLDHCLDRMAS